VLVGNLSSVATSIRDISGLLGSSQKNFTNLFAVLQTYRQNVEHVTESVLELNAGTSEILQSLQDLQNISGEVSHATSDIISQVRPFTETMNLVKTSSGTNYQLINETKTEVELVSSRAESLEQLGMNNTGVLEALKRELDGIKITDLSILTAVDNQRLVFWDPVRKVIPTRPDNPEKYPENDSRHWWDYEFAGWNIDKLEQPQSDADGPEGKRVAYMMASRLDGATYVNALQRGAEKVAKHHNINLTFYFADFNQETQAKQLDQALAAGVDLIILQAIDTEKIHPLIVRLYKMGIPIINSLQAVGNQTFPYVLNFTGPDDWGQTRRLARLFADQMDQKGGYAILQHVPGSSTEYGRTYGVITELREYAPQMVFLEKQYPDFKEEKAYFIVKDLIQRHGNRLNGLYCGDDNLLMLGVVKALRELDRTDVVVCAAGNSKVGMDFVKARAIHGINYQSAESAGALPVVSAIDWFNGVELPPITYLPIRMINHSNVDQFYPPQF
jgi:ABC-type sugar transport system substrate-binding protein